MSYINVFNKQAIEFYNNLKKDSTGTIVKGLGNAYNDAQAKIVYQNKKFEISLENKGPRGGKTNQFGGLNNVEILLPEKGLLLFKRFFYILTFW